MLRRHKSKMGANMAQSLSVVLLLLTNAALLGQDQRPDQPRPRARDLGITVGVLPPGPLNAITDVSGVKVGHTTLIQGEKVRTGVTAILPHGGTLFLENIPVAAFLG